MIVHHDSLAATLERRFQKTEWPWMVDDSGLTREAFRSIIGVPMRSCYVARG